MIKFNKKECYVTKRSLILDCVLNDYDLKDRHIRFEFDAWNENKYKKLFKVNGVKSNGLKIINYTKHELQVALSMEGVDGLLFIDRRYEHNSDFNVYFRGKVFLVKSIKREKELEESFKLNITK
jgi:hypothetical protein